MRLVTYPAGANGAAQDSYYCVPSINRAGAPAMLCWRETWRRLAARSCTHHAPCSHGRMTTPAHCTRTILVSTLPPRPACPGHEAGLTPPLCCCTHRSRSPRPCWHALPVFSDATWRTACHAYLDTDLRSYSIYTFRHPRDQVTARRSRWRSRWAVTGGGHPGGPGTCHVLMYPSMSR